MPPGSATLSIRRNVDAVAEDVVALDDDVADMNADAEADRIGAGARAANFALAELFLYLDGASNRVHRAGEFQQRTVAHELDDTAGMRGDRRIDQFAPQRVKPCKRPRLVDPHEARIPDHVGRQDRCQPPLQSFFSHAEKPRGKT